MHEWAITVERLSGRTGFDLKSSEGPKELQEFFGLASELMALDEIGEDVDLAKLQRMTELGDIALQFLSKGSAREGQ
jgi:hypothetical protein